MALHTLDLSTLHKRVDPALKNTWYESSTTRNSLPFPQSFTEGSKKNRRVVVLNKLFMKHITDLMATGQCSEYVAGLGIEVTKVDVSSGYNVVNVYWRSHGEKTEDELKSILRRTAGSLRNELSGLRVIGKVPEIQFVQDNDKSSWNTVESLLKTADLGENYEPRGYDSLKAEFSDGQCTDELPKMRQNVFGLDRGAILERLRNSMKGKSTKPVELNRTQHAVQFEPFDKEAFGQFLLKRKIDKDRIMKEERRKLNLDEIEYTYDHTHDLPLEDQENIDMEEEEVAK